MVMKVESLAEASIKLASLWGCNIRCQHMFNNGEDSFLAFAESSIESFFEMRGFSKPSARIGRVWDVYINTNRQSRPKGIVLFSKQDDGFWASDGINFLEDYEVRRLKP